MAKIVNSHKQKGKTKATPKWKNQKGWLAKFNFPVQLNNDYFHLIEFELMRFQQIQFISVHPSIHPTKQPTNSSIQPFIHSFIHLFIHRRS